MRRSDSEEHYPQFRTASMPKRPYRGDVTRPRTIGAKTGVGWKEASTIRGEYRTKSSSWSED